MTSLREIKRSVGGLTPKELAKLYAWLHTLLEDRKSKKPAPRTAKRHVGSKGCQTAHKTYCLERVRCGKENCKCAGGELHGPYWYAYWSEGGKTKSQYIGKRLPKLRKGKASSSRSVR